MWTAILAKYKNVAASTGSSFEYSSFDRTHLCTVANSTWWIRDCATPWRDLVICYRWLCPVNSTETTFDGKFSPDTRSASVESRCRRRCPVISPAMSCGFKLSVSRFHRMPRPARLCRVYETDSLDNITVLSRVRENNIYSAAAAYCSSDWVQICIGRQCATV